MKKTLLSAVLVLLAVSSYAMAAPSQRVNGTADSALARALGLVPAASSPQAMSGGSPLDEMPIGGCGLTSCTQARQQCLLVDCANCKITFSCDAADPCSYSCTCHSCVA